MSNFEYSDEMLVSHFQHTALEQLEEHFFLSPKCKASTSEAPRAPTKTHISLLHSRHAINPVKLSLIF